MRSSVVSMATVNMNQVKVATPVRRSTRTNTDLPQDEEVLRSADFNYMPNESLRDTFFNNADPIDLVSEDDD